MKIWIVAELDFVLPNSGAIIGTFTNEKLAKDFMRKKKKEGIDKIISLTEWNENEIIPVGERGVI